MCVKWDWSRCLINILEDVGTAFSNLAGRGYDDAILSGYDFCSAVAECVTSGEHLRMMDRTAGQAIFAKEIDRIAVEVDMITFINGSCLMVKAHRPSFLGRESMGEIKIHCQYTELLVADNRIAELASIDNDELAKLLSDLDGLDIDMELTGYSGKALDNLLADIRTHEVKEDGFNAAEAAVSIKKPVSKRGDVWILGLHRLMCGDSTIESDMAKLMDGWRAAMVFTDPPYNVDYQGSTTAKLKSRTII